LGDCEFDRDLVASELGKPKTKKPSLKLTYAISPLENRPKPKPQKREYKERKKILQASIFRGRAASPEW